MERSGTCEGRLILEIDIRELLPVAVLHDEAGIVVFVESTTAAGGGGRALFFLLATRQVSFVSVQPDSKAN
jgi:hypothetical protein